MFTLATDTSCDVFRSELDKLGIPWIPLTFTIDGVSYPDTFDCDEQYKEFYDKLRAGKMPSTSQINAFTQAEFLEKLVADGATDIVYLTLSGGLSGTYASACSAAQEVMEKTGCKINVVDTVSATQVHRWILDDAIKLRDQGMSGEEAAKILRETGKHLHTWILVDNLNHLKRGGRVSGAAAAIGTMLKIKPLLVFTKTGELKVVHKAIGFRKAMEHIADDIDKYAPDVKEIYFANADYMEKIEEMKAIILERHPDCKFKTGWVGPVIGAHTGDRMIGVIFKSDVERPY